MILSTTPTIEGRTIVEYRGVVFGEVIDGLDVVDKIAGVKTGYMDVPVEPVTIISITIEK